MPQRGPLGAAHSGRECGPCQLCGKTAPYYAHPATWDVAISARLYSIEESIQGESCICRACEKHIKRNITSENYKPRCHHPTVKCILPECTVTNNTGSIVHTGVVTQQQIQSLFKVTIGCEIGDSIPLCQAHYKHVHRLMNMDTYKHAKCSTCGVTLRGSVRHCPDPVVIRQHFSAHGDMDFDLTKSDVICTSCYNTHLEILRGSQTVSHDYELQKLLEDSCSTISAYQYTDYMRHGLLKAISKLGDILLNQLAILLPELYQFLITECMQKAGKMDIQLNEKQIQQEMPRRCFLSRLICFFGKHLAYDCKQRYAGVLLYRPGTDLLCCISKMLKVMQNARVSLLTVNEGPAQTQYAASSDAPVQGELEKFDNLYLEINNRLKNQVKLILDQDATMPCDISKFAVDDTISSIDPFLWRMVVNITKTTTESRHNTSSQKIGQQRKLSCLYCLCVMFFANNRCCSMPMHLLLTDLIESQGGSLDLIRILNRFGAVASSDTHRRYVQFKVQQKVSSGFLDDLNMDNFTVASVDNIDFLQRHSFVYCGDQSRSWHGTTMQVVQPLVDHQIAVPSRVEPQGTVHSPALVPAFKKVTRRSRSLSECKEVHSSIFQPHKALFQLTNPRSLGQLSYNHYTPLKSDHSLKEFTITESEEKELKDLEELALLYIAHR